MNKIVKYEVVSVELDEGGLFSERKTENDFTNLINKKIKQGYQPWGELKTSVETSGSFLGASSETRLTQVIVKYAT